MQVKKLYALAERKVFFGVMIAGVIATLACALLLMLSVVGFTHSGPPIPQEVLDSYSSFIIASMVRLSAWAWVLLYLMAYAGIIVCQAWCCIRQTKLPWWVVFVCGGTAVFVLTSIQFMRHLLYIPSSIIASFNYRISRLNEPWEYLSPLLFTLVDFVICAVFLGSLLWAYQVLMKRSERISWWFLGVTIFYTVVTSWAVWNPEPPLAQSYKLKRPNIVMIGSDTLRADRLGVNGYYRNLTPNIDGLARKGVNFSNFYVPIARTGPSMVSLLTSSYPPMNGIRTNFAGDDQKTLALAALPKILQESGYVTAAVSDWSGADLGKFDFGFDHVSVAPDQWNIKNLLSQGPKDIRLFISLFTHNRFGVTFLPELYYLAGVPLTQQKGLETRYLINKLSKENQPFFIQAFFAANHAPFGSDYPYYTMYSNKDYDGESKFVISGLSTIKGIIQRQDQSAAQFDIQQILDLYDGATKSFDDEVGRLVKYLEHSNLSDNTIVVIYSDHGTDLWENGLWGQGNSLSDNNHRVPLVMAGPGMPAGLSIDTTAPSIDLAPTLLDLVGLKPQPSFDGKSLLPALDRSLSSQHRLAYVETGLSLGRIPRENGGKPVTILDALYIQNHETGTMSIKPGFTQALIRSAKRVVMHGDERFIYDPLDAKSGEDASNQGGYKQKWLKEEMKVFLKQDRINVLELNK